MISDTSAALDLDNANVKAYYHRAVAHEASDSLEKAISGAVASAVLSEVSGAHPRRAAQISGWDSSCSRKTKHCAGG